MKKIGEYAGRGGGEEKMEIKKAITEFADKERKEAEEAKEKEKNQVCIDPDSYIAKEIKYQTALMHQILDEIRDIKKDGNRSSRILNPKD